MPAQTSVNGFLGVGTQSGADLLAAFVARTRFAEYFNCQFTAVHQEEVAATSRRSQQEIVALGPIDNRFIVEMPGTMNGPVTQLLKSVLGAYTSTQQGATAAYKHTSSITDTLAAANRLTLEKRKGTLAKAELMNVVCSTARYSFDQQGLTRWRFEGLGGKHEFLATPTVPTLPSVASYLSKHPMHTIDIAGVSNVPVRDGWWEIKRLLVENQYKTSSRSRVDAQYRHVEVDWEVQLGFEDLTWQERFWGLAGATAIQDVPGFYDMRIKGEHPTVIASTFKFTNDFHAPRSFVQSFNAPQEGTNAIIQTLRGRAVYDVATTKAVSVDITNDLTTV